MACSGGGPASSAIDLEALPAYSLRATGDLRLPEPMTMATYVPNHVAAWAGHILLLSESGAVWRTSSEGETPKSIAPGPYVDIYGLSRPNKAGLFLALGEGGKLSAFIEADDEGNFKSLPVSYGGPEITAFCEGPGFASSWLIGANEAIYAFSVDVKDEAIAEITIEGGSAPNSKAMGCHAPAHERYYYQKASGKYVGKNDMAHWDGASDVSPIAELGQMGYDPQTGTPLLFKDGALHMLEIEDGLSIKGIEAANFISATSYAMGSVFNPGIILIGDKTENRMVMMSMGYARRALEESAKTEANGAE